MLLLAPSNPRSHAQAGDALQCGGVILQHEYKQAAESYLRASRLGKQQGSEYWTVMGAAVALKLAACNPLAVGPGSFEQTGKEALHRFKRLLPDLWVREVEQFVDLLMPLLPAAREQLQLLQQTIYADTNSSSCGRGISNKAALRQQLLDSGAAQEALFWKQMTDVVGMRRVAKTTECDGCRIPADGVRSCLRCKKAQYCRCALC